MRIVCFAPYAAIWQHAIPEALVLDSLRKKGHEIYYITCEENLNQGCVAMSSCGIDFNSENVKKKNVCLKCKNNKNLILNSFGFNELKISSVAQLFQHQINTHLENLTQENFIDFTLDDLPLGKFAAYGIVLKYKKNELNFNDVEWHEYLVEIKNSLITYYATKHFLEALNPDRSIVYNPFYPTNRVFSTLCVKKNIPLYWLHAGANWATRLQTLILCRNDGLDWINSLLKLWYEKYQYKTCSKNAIKLIEQHFTELFKGQNSFVYSSQIKKNVDLAQLFKIQPSQKVVLAALSSDDEKYAAELINALSSSKNTCFETQVVWLENLIEYFTHKPNCKLIIRVHPRIFNNKRENVVSEFATILEKLFSNLPSNIVVNWPKDEISLYQMIDIVDLCLHSGSSVAKELAIFGIPVINYLSCSLGYPKDLTLYANDRDEYFSLIEEALQLGRSEKYSIQAFRWHALELEYALLDISDGFSLKDVKKTSIITRIIKGILRRIDPLYFIKQELKQLPPKLKCFEQINALIEKEEVISLNVSDFQEKDHLSADEEKLMIDQTIKSLVKLKSELVY